MAKIPLERQTALMGWDDINKLWVPIQVDPAGHVLTSKKYADEEWKIVMVEKVPRIGGVTGRWTCPKGLYEVYASIDMFHVGLLLYSPDGLLVASLAYFAGSIGAYGQWLPLSSGTDVVISWTLRVPNTGHDADSTIYSGVTASRGWILSTGEYLLPQGGNAIWAVRYRRVG